MTDVLTPDGEVDTPTIAWVSRADEPDPKQAVLAAVRETGADAVFFIAICETISTGVKRLYRAWWLWYHPERCQGGHGLPEPSEA